MLAVPKLDIAHLYTQLYELSEHSQLNQAVLACGN